MVFSSLLFLLVFLPIFLLVYHISHDKLKNYVLLIFSLVFYAWGAPKFIFLLLISMIINFYIVKLIAKYDKNVKVYLIISLFINIGLLAYFKYANFFIDNLNFVLLEMGVRSVRWTKIILPIGISFFTFQSITYTLDVYRKVHQPLKKLSDYLVYILMFPQLIAGPIVRFNTVADDILDRRHNDNIDNKLHGVYLFIIGLSKKVLIANVLGEQVDILMDGSLDFGTGTAWLGIIAYSFQIYFDFSGYSDMAIGLGKIIGFKFPENFNNPYISQNISEFWRRWHITLGRWMRDYLYIPLGGNRNKSNFRIYLNLIIVFLISGLWHGANWNFIIWGAWHGLFLILDRLFLIKLLKNIGKIPRMILNYIVVLVGWVFFRIEDLEQAGLYLKKMFSFDFSYQNIEFSNEFIAILILAGFISFIGISKIGEKMQDVLYAYSPKISNNIVRMIIGCVFLVICLAYVSSSGFNPFIYFRF